MIPTKTKIRSLLVLTSLGLSLCAQAGEVYTAQKEVIPQRAPHEARLWVSLAAGGEFDVHATKFISNGGGTLFTRGGVGLPVKVQSRDFASTHAAGMLNGRLEVGYLLTNEISLFGGFTYSHVDGNDSRKAGRVTDLAGTFGPAREVYDLYADVGDYNAYAGMVGIKLLLPRAVMDSMGAPRTISPYISGSVGGKYVEASDIRFYNGGGPRFLNTQRVTLYDDSWVFTTELNLGIDFEVAHNFSIVAEAGYGFDTKPEAGGQVLPGLNGTDKGGDRVYNTVSLGGKLKF